MQFLKLSTHTMIIESDEAYLPNSVEVEYDLAAGRVAVVHNDNVPADLLTEEVTLAEIQEGMEAMVAGLSESFVAREGLAQVAALSLMTGLGFYAVSQPGTAKTSFGKAIAKYMGGKFFKKALTDEITDSDLYGGYDPEAGMQGRVVRKYDHLAVADFALLDEVDKAPSNVVNKGLDAMEEKMYGDSHLPLLAVMGAGNALPESQASYDRFALRTHLEYITDESDFFSLVGADAGRKRITQVINPWQLLLCQAACEFMAMHVSDDIKVTLFDIKETAEESGFIVSDRNWPRIVTAGCALSILNGEAFDSEHLDVAKHVIWSDPKDMAEAAKVVTSCINPLAAVMLEVKAVYEDALKAYEAHDFDTTDHEVQGRVTGLFDEVLIAIDEAKDENEALTQDGNKLASELNDITIDCNTKSLGVRTGKKK